MIEKIKDIINKTAEKIPEEKRPKIIVAVGIGLMALILLSGMGTKTEKTQSTETQVQPYLYSEEIEQKLEKIISSIQGAGRCKVMVTLDTSEENVYAFDINDSKNEYVVIKTNSDEGGLLIKIIQPKIRGVAVVCDGGDTYTTVNSITETVCSVLGISSTKVSVAKMQN